MRTACLLISNLCLLLALSGCASQAGSHFVIKEACDRYADMQCANRILSNAEIQLDAVYHQVAATQEEESIKRLALSQRNWVKYRDSFSDYISGRESDAQLLKLSLINRKIDMTLHRIEELHQSLKK